MSDSKIKIYFNSGNIRTMDRKDVRIVRTESAIALDIFIDSTVESGKTLVNWDNVSMVEPVPETDGEDD